MRTASVFAAMLVSALAAESALCDDMTLREVSEEAMRTASARLYSDILFRACINGRRYSRSQIERGFKRHASEMKLQLEDQGHRIAPDGATTPSLNSPSRVIVAKPEPSERRFGCFRRYWLDD